MCFCCYYSPLSFYIKYSNPEERGGDIMRRIFRGCFVLVIIIIIIVILSYCGFTLCNTMRAEDEDSEYAVYPLSLVSEVVVW